MSVKDEVIKCWYMTVMMLSNSGQAVGKAQLTILKFHIRWEEIRSI